MEQIANKKQRIDRHSVWLSVIGQLPNLPRKEESIKVETVRPGRGENIAWTDSMCNVMTKFYPVKSNNYLAAKLRKGKTTIREQAEKMGLVKVFNGSRSPERLYKEVVRYLRDDASHAMMMMKLGISELEIERAIQHYERHG